MEVLADLTKHGELEDLFNKTIEKYGKLDVLVNNAGSFITASINDPDFFDKFDKKFNNDVVGALRLIRLSIPYLKQTKGSIISLSSILTKRPVPGLSTPSVNL